jgi:hypothetical protein
MTVFPSANPPAHDCTLGYGACPPFVGKVSPCELLFELLDLAILLVQPFLLFSIFIGETAVRQLQSALAFRR